MWPQIRAQLDIRKLGFGSKESLAKGQYTVQCNKFIETSQRHYNFWIWHLKALSMKSIPYPRLVIFTGFLIVFKQQTFSLNKIMNRCPIYKTNKKRCAPAGMKPWTVAVFRALLCSPSSFPWHKAKTESWAPAWGLIGAPGLHFFLSFFLFFFFLILFI